MGHIFTRKGVGHSLLEEFDFYFIGQDWQPIIDFTDLRLQGLEALFSTGLLSCHLARFTN